MWTPSWKVTQNAKKLAPSASRVQQSAGSKINKNGAVRTVKVTSVDAKPISECEDMPSLENLPPLEDKISPCCENQIASS